MATLEGQASRLTQLRRGTLGAIAALPSELAAIGERASAVTERLHRAVDRYAESGADEPEGLTALDEGLSAVEALHFDLLSLKILEVEAAELALDSHIGTAESAAARLESLAPAVAAPEDASTQEA